MALRLAVSFVAAVVLLVRNVSHGFQHPHPTAIHNNNILPSLWSARYRDTNTLVTRLHAQKNNKVMIDKNEKEKRLWFAAPSTNQNSKNLTKQKKDAKETDDDHSSNDNKVTTTTTTVTATAATTGTTLAAARTATTVATGGGIAATTATTAATGTAATSTSTAAAAGVAATAATSSAT
eukprot:scaffold81780_cov30-Attheya_sp.AAC.1